MQIIAIVTSVLLASVGCDRAKCGVPKNYGNQLIVQGQDTAAGDWPWHAAIFHKNRGSTNYTCGGTVISNHFILTAAHCVIRANGYLLAPKNIFVRVGIHNLDEENPQFAQKHHVEKIHKFQNFTKLVNDIGLIQLNSLIVFNDHVLPVCMNLTSNITGEIGAVVGWGLTEKDETFPELKKAMIPVIDPLICLATNRALFGQTLSHDLFCAGYKNGTSVCNGDSGGGLVFKRGDKWFLGGIVSISQQRTDGSNKCYTEGYAAFVSVQYYLPWISANTGINFQYTGDNCGERKIKSRWPMRDGNEQETFHG
ncbi:chymotrypsinogen B-like [Wyeomyia smithii]|uniref:chymotrypsinogen B-like n=1 Tax=Wyeomyia smithii TaxID=174621 RepID=UPI002467ECCF|nr:chymotrypsinogen B-like [Wyeomyia smithii]